MIPHEPHQQGNVFDYDEVTLIMRRGLTAVYQIIKLWPSPGDYLISSFSGRRAAD